MHGGEESGTDASLRVLYELADRSDCAAQRILDQAVVVILPIQNPDGREADTRRNAYGFDMNRDWFARTQPETDGKVELLRRYPRRAVHRRARDGRARRTSSRPTPTRSTTRSPTRRSTGSTTSTAPSMQDEFDERGIPYFNYDTYDLFYAGYGDTVPANGFGAAGMTFEKASGDPTPQRVLRAVPHPVDLALGGRDQQGADPARVARLLGRGRAPGRGRASSSPTGPTSPACPSASPCPTRSVRHYFLRADDPDKAREVQALVRRLQRMDVEVRRLTRAADACPTTAPTAARRRRRRCRRGTYWIPMAQRQKHWVQAMLNESTYTPVGYAYDIVGWSSRCCSTSRAAPRARCCRRGPTVAGAQAEPGAAGAAGQAARRSRCTRCRRSSRAGSSPRAGCAGCSTAGASTTAT